MRIAVYFEFDIISSQNTLRGVTLKDSHGRTIDYLRISLTDRCNFRCVYCMPEEGVCAMSHDEILRIEEIERLVAVAAGLGIRSVRLTAASRWCARAWWSWWTPSPASRASRTSP